MDLVFDEAPCMDHLYGGGAPVKHTKPTCAPPGTVFNSNPNLTIAKTATVVHCTSEHLPYQCRRLVVFDQFTRVSDRVCTKGLTKVLA
jgi:hypothetical protein